MLGRVGIGEAAGSLIGWVDVLRFDGATLSRDGRTVTITITGGGGGVTDHRLLDTMSLSWVSSGHTGTANRLAGFDGSGNAGLVTLTSPLSLSGGSLSIDLSAYLTITDADATYLAIADAAATYLTAASAAATYLTITDAAADYQPLDADLTALAGLASTGLIVRTGAGAVVARTITAGAGVTVVNGDGVSGPPTISITGGSNTDFNAAYGRTFWFQPAGAGIQAEGTTVSYGAGAPSDGTTTTEPVANFSATGVGNGKTMLGGAHARMGFGGTMYVRFTVDVTSNVRYFFALTASATGATPPPANCVGLIYDSGVNANWRMVGTNTPATNVTYKDLGVTPLANKVYLLTITTTTTTATVALENLTDAVTVSATIDTALSEFLPGTSSNLLFNMAVVSITGTAKVIGFRGAHYRAEY